MLAPAIYRMEPDFAVLEGGTLRSAAQRIGEELKNSVPGTWLLVHDDKTRCLLEAFLDQSERLQQTYEAQRDHLAQVILTETNLKPATNFAQPQSGEINARAAAHALIWRVAVTTAPVADRPLSELDFDPPGGSSADSVELHWRFSNHSMAMLACGTWARMEGTCAVLARIVDQRPGIDVDSIEDELRALGKAQATLIRRLETVKSHGGPKGTCSDCAWSWKAT